MAHERAIEDTSKFTETRDGSAPKAIENRRMTRSVLIVDDHAGFRGLARRLVQGAGYRVVGEATDGRSAIEAATVLNPDVVLLDVVLPDMSGFDVAGVLTREGARASVLLTSSRSSDDLGPLLHEGALRFISKLDLGVDSLREAIG